MDYVSAHVRVGACGGSAPVLVFSSCGDAQIKVSHCSLSLSLILSCLSFVSIAHEHVYSLQGSYPHQALSLSLSLARSLSHSVSLNDFPPVSLPPPLSLVSVSVPIASLPLSVTYSRWCIDCTQTLAFPLADSVLCEEEEDGLRRISLLLKLHFLMLSCCEEPARILSLSSRKILL